MRKFLRDKNTLLTFFFSLAAIAMMLIPSTSSDTVHEASVRCKGEVMTVDDAGVVQLGMIKKGSQDLIIKILDGPYKGGEHDCVNQLMGQLDRDKLFKVGDTALVVLSLNEKNEIVYVNPQAHYRLGVELILLWLFVGALIIFGGWTGVRALLSFVLSAISIWKILIPLFLKGYDPVMVSLLVLAALCTSIIFLVAGVTRKGITAFAGAFCGILLSCVLSVYFTDRLHIHGAIMPFSETLLYSGFGHLDLTRIYIAAVFIAASGAVMDLAMDVAASMDEVVAQNPSISRKEAFLSGLRISRTVVGTMTTTLLLAYSGGYITLLMAFMAQGIPLANVFNLIYVAAEVLKTLVGSFGLVTVGPFTALIGAWILPLSHKENLPPRLKI